MKWNLASGQMLRERLLRAAVICAFISVFSLTAVAKGNPETFFKALLQDEQVSSLNQAFATLWIGDDLPHANVLLREAFARAMGDADSLTPDVADAKFKWQMRTWVRIYYLFGNERSRFGARLDEDNRDRIEKLLWDYGVAKSSLARANLKYVWFIQGSENHDMMDLGNAFLALQAIARDPAYADRRLPDGGTPSEHVSAWTDYFQHYCQERIRNGLIIEVASPTYGKYLVPELVNISDFAEDEVLRETATNLLNLMWADWAIEQLNGVRGGAKARCYQGNYSRSGHADSWYQMGRYLVTQGEWTDTGSSRHPIMGFNLCLASSNYDLPDVVRALATDPEGRGEYVYVSRRPGKMMPIDTVPPHGDHSCWYSMDPQDSRLVRYTWCTPDHVMGCFLSDPKMREDFIVRPDQPKRTANSYAAIHAQNRWQGIIFATDPDARIFPQCEGTPDKKKPGLSTTYMQQVAVQHENVMIVQMNRTDPHNTAMRIYFAPKMRERIEMEDGWRIVEEGNSYVAVKILSQEDGRNMVEADWDDHGLLRPDDPYAPVIFVTGRKKRFANVGRFLEYLTGHTYEVSDGTLTYRFTDSHGTPIELGLDLKKPRIPTKNGKPVNLNPEKTYDSPYIATDRTNHCVRITFAGQELAIDTSTQRD